MYVYFIWLQILPFKLELGLPPGRYGLVPVHMPAFISGACLRPPVYSACTENDVKVLASPGGTGRTICRNNNIFEVLSRLVEDHYSI